MQLIHLIKKKGGYYAVKQSEESSIKMKRLSVTYPAVWAHDLLKLKKEYYFDKSMAELVRHLLAIGLNHKDELPHDFDTGITKGRDLP